MLQRSRVLQRRAATSTAPRTRADRRPPRSTHPVCMYMSFDGKGKQYYFLSIEEEKQSLVKSRSIKLRKQKTRSLVAVQQTRSLVASLVATAPSSADDSQRRNKKSETSLNSCCFMQCIDERKSSCVIVLDAGERRTDLKSPTSTRRSAKRSRLRTARTWLSTTRTRSVRRRQRTVCETWKGSTTCPCSS